MPLIPRLHLLRLWQRFLADSEKSKDSECFNEHSLNPNLKNELKNEYPAILAWLRRGQEIVDLAKELPAPASIQKYKSEYLKGVDLVRKFLDECCHLDKVMDPKFAVPVDFLIAVYKKWCADRGVNAGKQTDFRARVLRITDQDDTRKAIGFHDAHKARFQGIQLAFGPEPKPDISQYDWFKTLVDDMPGKQVTNLKEQRENDKTPPSS